MKLIRHGVKGSEKPAFVHTDGTVRDLSGIVDDITSELFVNGELDKLLEVDPLELPVVDLDRIGVPWVGAGKFIAIGLNYADHAAEANMPIPPEPIVFSKMLSCMSGCNDPVVLPKGSTKSDWEVELGVVIGKRARYVTEQDALSYVAGYCIVNDLSEREYQLERGGTWDKGKGCDTFGPIGPWLVTKDEITDPQNLHMWLDINGNREQVGNTKTMIFSVAHLISYLSKFMTLEPGDLITTGTPPGVGMGKKPFPRFLKPGDVITLGIERLGEQRQVVYEWDEKLIDI
ncbi:fumarylacetoacetate hydrolase family protein [Leeia sp. TBRC 13508]|uniref:Fumarylacetoacetate hydrolase family protein n=1 Tax=Leeia speluncae TaxID=2884804 RepID=A0ABS8DAC2_9NEIS|nr:fumarylacetoacetate hydrolase family protein [Leeia speluncae]MCB6185159.1 fumarylacetoacetate hydrolase family protein [Leeia speluncae]